MILESRFASGFRWSIIILVILGWILAFPLLKFGVDARLEKTINDSSILFFHALLGLTIVSYMLFKHKVKSVEFNDYKEKVAFRYQNTLGQLTLKTISYNSINFYELKTTRYASVDVYSYGKRVFTVYKRDFSDKVFSEIVSNLIRIRGT